LPHLIPPSATAYEADRDALTAQFDAAAELIKDIQSEAVASRSIVEEQREKVDSALDKLQIAINETKEGEARAKADLREIRDEVNNVRDMLPKVGLQ
jgi:peroxin-14